MARFRFFDAEKQEESSAIRRISEGQLDKFDQWVSSFGISEKNKGGFFSASSSSSPLLPSTTTAEEAKMLEEEQIECLLEEFDMLVQDKTRVRSQWALRRRKLQEALQWRKGALHRTICTNHANEFHKAAFNAMQYCMQTFNDFSNGLEDLVVRRQETPSGLADDIDIVFQNILENCNQFANETVPGGVRALENHVWPATNNNANADDGILLASSVLSYGEFLQMLEQRKQEYHKEIQRRQRRQQEQEEESTALEEEVEVAAAVATPTTTTTGIPPCPGDSCKCCLLRSIFHQVLDAQQNDPNQFAKYWNGQPIGTSL